MTEIRFQMDEHPVPDYGISTVGKCPGPTKDGFKIYLTYVSQSIGDFYAL